MKYCRHCKLRAADTDTVCARCGQALTELGRPAPDAAAEKGAPDPPALSLQGQIRELEQVRERNLRSSRRLALVAAGILLALVAALYNVYSHTVLSYAVLSNIEIEQDQRVENQVRISFEVVRPGKVAYDRRSGGRRTEKVDWLTNTGRQSLVWAWPSAPETGLDLSVVFRTGWTRSMIERHFDITGKRTGGMVDVVFLLDTTGSMDPFIAGLQERCIQFAEIVRSEGHDCHLGLIGFGDVDNGEPMSVFEPTGELQKFQEAVAQAPRTRGGDDPESAIEAIARARQLAPRVGATLCLVLITDAPCHHDDQIAALSRALTAQRTVLYAVSRKELANLYSPLCVNGGRFFALEEARFEDILAGVARSITNQIRTD
ncbi:MAG: vWA domain-containing protein [Planctomycetales bacterium]